jgi:1,4-alpha-glucan branching enzyme
MRDNDRKKRVRFQFTDIAARKVFLAGSFNAWDPSVRPLKKNAEGLWRTTVALEHGVYQYRFIVDGEWKEDPSFQNKLIDGSVAFNSVIVV